MKLWFYRCSVIAVLALLASSVGLADGYDFIWSGPTSGGIWQDTNWNAGLATGPLGSYSSIPVASVYIGPATP